MYVYMYICIYIYIYIHTNKCGHKAAYNSLTPELQDPFLEDVKGVGGNEVFKFREQSCSRCIFRSYNHY